ncbi:MAG: hypothetical protein AAGH41_13850 [Pseudomonadota bacterium]
MSDETLQTDFNKFGSGEFEFGKWPTPFADAAIEILELVHSPRRRWPDDAAFHYRMGSLLRSHYDVDLVARIYVYEPDKVYRVAFDRISAMRLLDEGGLLELWAKTEELGGRPGQTTFRVRNHAWTAESIVSFLATDGWSFVIASDNECLEVVSANPPVIDEEPLEASSPDCHERGEGDR